MEAVIFIGIQASGKTTFYCDRFVGTHVRLSLDLLKTCAREQAFLRTCLETRQPFVVDKTNATAEQRARYIAPARAAGFRVVGYFFETTPREAIGRNAPPPGRAREFVVEAA